MFSKQTFLLVTICCVYTLVISEPLRDDRYYSINDILARYYFGFQYEQTTDETSTIDTSSFSTIDTSSFSTIDDTSDSTIPTTNNIADNNKSTAKSFDYCQMCYEPGAHTLCKYPTCDVAGNCTLMKQIPLNSNEKQLIVKYHNELRNKVARGLVDKQPSATNMQELEWDSDLEYTAQCWANQCKFEHDKCRDTPADYVGQNIVFHGSTLQSQTLKESLKGLIDDWFNEYVDLPNEYIPSRPWNNPTFTSHYTQLVWAETNRIGCARVYAYQEPFYSVYLYCNYAPGGNNVNAPIYIIGPPATDCHKYGLKKSVNFSGLCH